MGRTRNVWVGLACGAALGIGGIIAVDAATGPAEAQGGFSVTPGQLRINQKISQAAVRRANQNRQDIEALQGAVGTNGATTGATGATGATGPQGPAGPQGTAGPQGPSGLAGVEAVSGDPVSLPTGAANNGSIECPAGKVAIGGGVAQTNAGGVAVLSTAGTNISLVRSSPSSPTRWTAGVENTGTTDRFFKVTVICATVGP